MLYPMQTESRLCLSLDGIWNFALIPYGEPYDPAEPLRDGRPIPVPSSYNDIYEGREVRDHIGEVVYERVFEQPARPADRSVLLRFGSVTHSCRVFLNGRFLGSHKGGFLPFEFDISAEIKPGTNRLTVIANNIIDHTTLPVGTLQEKELPGLGKWLMDFPNFDFFNYSGIMRPVKLIILPKNHITGIMVCGTAEGKFRYEAETSGAGSISAALMDGESVLWTGEGPVGEGVLEGVRLWSPDDPHLYALRVTLTGPDGTRDVYTEEFGFRSVEVRDCGFYLNGKKLYLKGFGKHEDTPVLGRGLSEAYNVKDLALMKWINANSFRTSHYPYSEEMMRLCDRMGILVIDETPAVGMHTNFTASGMPVLEKSPTWKTLKTREHHLDVLHDLILRDRNHPCVIIWSVANEPASEEPGAYDYFKPLFEYVRQADPQHRPVTFVTHGESTVEICEVAPLCDVLMLNRYYGWYECEGNLKAAGALLSDELDRYHTRYPDKPIMLGEFGADAVAGLHDSTPLMFSEEFQRDMLDAYCGVLDRRDYIFGEHIWNFADFATAESVKRVQGNKKGVFTRERKPKLAAWYLKERWGKKC